MTKIYPVFLLLFFCIQCVYGQQKNIHYHLLRPSDTLHKPQKDTNRVAQLDLIDIAKEVLHKKTDTSKVVKQVSTKPEFSAIPAFGYTLVSRFAVSLTGNAAFRIDTNDKISTVTGITGYTENKQLTFQVESEIWLNKNNYELIGDYRFYKYPQSTFGLGSSSNIKNEDPLDYNFLRIYETLLRKISGNFLIGAGYIIDYHSHISEKGNLNGVRPSDFSLYGDGRRTISTGYTLNAEFDSRDNSINPSAGFFAGFQFRDNYRFLGSTSDWRSIILDIRKYFRFPEGSENVIAIWNYDWLTINGKPPYLDLPSTQWDPYSSNGRGYIQGRFRGAKEVYLETEYRYGITRNGLLGGVAFLNLQSFSGAPGTRLQAIQPGFGPGLRIKLNKVSKTNIAIDYGFGRQGSRGLFVNVGELF
ncbi:MAG: hypothetical protein JO080_08750 [Mucilaginibacter sp.]|nr:hypothetical protein [Mucilaginibacter sp.]